MCPPHVLLVHGTPIPIASFGKPETKFVKELVQAVGADNISRFAWRGLTQKKRRRESVRLSRTVATLVKQHERVYIVAHSNGGNLSLDAIALLESSTQNLYLVTIATPFLHAAERVVESSSVGLIITLIYGTLAMSIWGLSILRILDPIIMVMTFMCCTLLYGTYHLFFHEAQRLTEGLTAGLSQRFAKFYHVPSGASPREMLVIHSKTGDRIVKLFRIGLPRLMRRWRTLEYALWNDLKKSSVLRWRSETGLLIGCIVMYGCAFGLLRSKRISAGAFVVVSLLTVSLLLLMAISVVVKMACALFRTRGARHVARVFFLSLRHAGEGFLSTGNPLHLLVFSVRFLDCPSPSYRITNVKYIEVSSEIFRRKNDWWHNLTHVHTRIYDDRDVVEAIVKFIAGIAG